MAEAHFIEADLAGDWIADAGVDELDEAYLARQAAFEDYYDHRARFWPEGRE